MQFGCIYGIIVPWYFLTIFVVLYCFTIGNMSSLHTCVTLLIIKYLLVEILGFSFICMSTYEDIPTLTKLLSLGFLMLIPDSILLVTFPCQVVTPCKLF